MSTIYSIGSMNQLSDALEKVGFTPDELTKLRQPKVLSGVLGIIRETHEIKPIDYIIDLSVPCELPFAGAENISAKKSGVVKLERRGDDLFVDGQKINLFLSDQQKVGTHGGHGLRQVLEARGGNQSAKLLDHLKAHPELWPESWKNDSQGRKLCIFFWDDIFRRSDGDLYVRFGYWNDGEVVSDYRWLYGGWDVGSPSASAK